MPVSVYIKNMYGISCIKHVQKCFEDLEIKPTEVSLGKVVLQNEPKDTEQLRIILLKKGYDLIKDNKANLTAQVKMFLFEWINSGHLENKLRLNDFLKGRINYEYHYLSMVFSNLEGTTIEKFFIKIKINKVKELISQGTFNLSEIAHQFGYSSPAHLSSQFRKVEGIPPSQYRKKIKKEST